MAFKTRLVALLPRYSQFSLTFRMSVAKTTGLPLSQLPVKKYSISPLGAGHQHFSFPPTLSQRVYILSECNQKLNRSFFYTASTHGTERSHMWHSKNIRAQIVLLTVYTRFQIRRSKPNRSQDTTPIELPI